MLRAGAMTFASLGRVTDGVLLTAGTLLLLACSGVSPTDRSEGADEDPATDEKTTLPPRTEWSSADPPVGLDVVLPWQASFRFVQQGRFSDGSMGLVRYIGPPLAPGACLMGSGRVGTRDGDCCLWNGDESPASARDPSVGRVTVENVTRGDARTEALSPKGGNGLGAWAPWSSGELVELRTEGGSLPPFAVRATGPAFLDPLREPLVVSRSQGITRPFTPIATGRAELALLGAGRAVECHASAAAGVVSIPGALASRVLVGADTVVVVLARHVSEERALADRGAATLALVTELVDGVDVRVVP